MSDFELIRRRLEGRLSPLESLQIENDRIPQASVTLILREESGETNGLIIKRAEREGDPWSGHLALPGGRAQTGDQDLLATAARETLEEIGLNLIERDGSRRLFLGRLPLLSPTNPRLPGIEITPFVALAPEDLSLKLNHEVDAAFWLPINRIKREGLSGSYSMRFGEVVKRWPAYHSEAGPIWGITERILTSFLSLID